MTSHVGWNDYSRVDMVGLRNLAFAEDRAASWQQVRAWRMAFELTDAQRGQLTRYREALSYRWTGPAAELFLAEMDRQIASLKSLGETALANERQAQAVAYSVQETQQKVEQLHESWQRLHLAAGSLREQERLTEQARQVLLAHSDTLVQASSTMIQPDGYVSPSRVFGQRPVTAEHPGNVLDGVTGSPARSPSAVSSGPELVGSAVAAEGSPMLSVPVSPHLSGSTSGVSEVPGGSVPTWGVAQPTRSVWIEPNTGRRVAPPVIGARSIGSPVEPGVERPPSGAAIGTGRSVSGLPVEDPPVRGGPSERPMLGMPVAGAAGAVRGGGEQSRTARRVNPVGGVIGGGSRPGGEVHTLPGGYTMTMSAAGERATAAGDRSAALPRAAVDKFAQWPVKQGVPPVIYPPPEPYHDPGPGVFGIDR